jgi:hypothetical protein
MDLVGRHGPTRGSGRPTARATAIARPFDRRKVLSSEPAGTDRHENESVEIACDALRKSSLSVPKAAMMAALWAYRSRSGPSSAE